MYHVNPRKVLHQRQPYRVRRPMLARLILDILMDVQGLKIKYEPS